MTIFSGSRTVSGLIFGIPETFGIDKNRDPEIVWDPGIDNPNLYAVTVLHKDRTKRLKPLYFV
jgi:hypothetical protein